VVVAAPNWVGDVVMATPAFRAVRASCPGARVTLLVRPYTLPVLAGAPWFDRVVEISGKPRSLAALVRASVALRKARADLAVVFPNSFRSALMAWLGGARMRVGYERDGRSILLTSAEPRPWEAGRFRPVYMAEYYLALLRPLGMNPAGTALELFVTEEEDRKARDLFDRWGLGPDDPVVGVNPGAAWGSSKCWPPERFAEAADRISRASGARILVLTGPGEEEVGERIAETMQTPCLLPSPAEIPLDVLKPVVRRLGLLVTNDTGPRHYASALGTPAVVVMGPTDPRYTSRPDEDATVLQSERDCVPCHLKTCPRGHECMLDISPESVAEAALERLSSGA
jgi:heptosyltransferase-2